MKDFINKQHWISMAKYIKKPVEVEAIQLTDESVVEIIKWATDYINIEVTSDDDDNITGLLIPTLEGMMKASMGDYIIKGVQDEFYPCKPDIFEKTYKLVN